MNSRRTGLVVLVVIALLIGVVPAAVFVPRLLEHTASPTMTRPSQSAAPGRASGPVNPFLPNPRRTVTLIPAPTPSELIRQQAPAPKPAGSRPAVPLVVTTFRDGTDGWIQIWGHITVKPVTQPAYDGASLLLTMSGGSNAAVGTAGNDVTRLVPGDTVTYHVRSTGSAGSVQPFVADDNNTIIYAGSASLPHTPRWFTLTWTVPATTSIEGIGLQVTDPHPGSGSVTLAIGGLSWPRR